LCDNITFKVYHLRAVSKRTPPIWSGHATTAVWPATVVGQQLNEFHVRGQNRPPTTKSTTTRGQSNLTKSELVYVFCAWSALLP